MKPAEQISTEILDKYGLTIDMSIPIEEAVKQAREDLLEEFADYLCDNRECLTIGIYYTLERFKEKI